MPDQMYGFDEFARDTRAAYPELAHITDDATLAHAVLATHPEFAKRVIDPLPAGMNAPPPSPTLPGGGVGAPGPVPLPGAPPPAPPMSLSALWRQKFGQPEPTEAQRIEVAKITTDPFERAARGVQLLAGTKDATPDEQMLGAAEAIKGAMSTLPAMTAIGGSMGTVAGAVKTAAMLGAGGAAESFVEPRFKTFMSPGAAALASVGVGLAAGIGVHGAMGAGEATLADAAARRVDIANAKLAFTKEVMADRAGAGPFDYLTTLQSLPEPPPTLDLKGPPVNVYAPATGQRLLGPGTPPPDFVAGTPDALNRLDFTGPNPPIGVPQPAPEDQIPDLVNSIGELVGNTLERGPGAAGGPPRLVRTGALNLTAPDTGTESTPDQLAFKFGARRRKAVFSPTPIEPGAPTAVSPAATDQPALDLPAPESPTAPAKRTKAGFFAPEHDEIDKIAAELEYAPYQERRWLGKATVTGALGQDTFTVPGATGKGTEEIPFIPGHAGASVYDDIIQAREDINPTAMPKPGAEPRSITRGDMLEAVKRFQKTGKGVWGPAILKVAGDRARVRAAAAAAAQEGAAAGEAGAAGATGEYPASWDLPPDEAAPAGRQPGEEDTGPPAFGSRPLPGQRSIWDAIRDLGAGEEGVLRVGPREEQPRLPGAEEDRVEAPSLFEVPFTLTPPPGAPAAAGKQEDLFGRFPEPGEVQPPTYAPGAEFVPRGEEGQQGGASPEAPRVPAEEAAYRRLLASGGREPGAPLTSSEAAQRSFFDRLKSETGELKLTMAFGPKNRKAMGDWLDDHAADFGDTDWYDKALNLHLSGDNTGAYRVAAAASGDEFSRAASRAGIAPGSWQTAPPDRNQQPIRSYIEEQAGAPLPKNASISAAGTVVFPKNPGGLDPKYTDLLMGRSFVQEAVNAIDPANIVHFVDKEGRTIPSGDLPQEQRKIYQIAHEIVTNFPEVLTDTLEQTGQDVYQYGASIVRAVSQAAKTLADISKFSIQNRDVMTILRPIGGGEGGPDIPELTHTEFKSWIQDTATPEQLKAIGFSWPEYVKPGTPEAATYAQRWLLKQRRLAEFGKSVDRIAAENADLDKAAIGYALTPADAEESHPLKATARIMTQALLSQAATATKVLFGHTMRYNLETVEEAMSGAGAQLMGNADRAAMHYNRAMNLAKAETAPGVVPTALATHPTATSLQTMYDFTVDTVKDLPAADRRRSLAVLDEFARQAARHTGTSLFGVDTTGIPPTVQKALNVATVLMRGQSAAVRTAAFDAELRTQIQSKGIDPVDVLGQPYPGIAMREQFGREEADRIVGAAVSKGLEMTYASAPMPGSFPAALVGIFSEHPLVKMATGQWFPRFDFATVPRWMWDHFPAAPVFDILGKVIPDAINRVGGTNIQPRGRLARGMDLSMLQEHTLPSTLAEMARTEYDAAVQLGTYGKARTDALMNAKAITALETRMDKGVLPGMSEELTTTHASLQANLAASESAMQQYKQTGVRLKDLEAQRRVQAEKISQLQEIGAPPVERYIANKAIGTLLFATAYAVRASQAADDTKYYQVRTPAAAGGHLLDLRPAIPGSAPFLLLADVFHDVGKQWDQAAYAKARAAGVSPIDAMEQTYQGKYTAPDLRADLVEAFMSTRALVQHGSLAENLMAPSAESPHDWTHAFGTHVLAAIGETIATMTTPGRTLSDAIGAFYPPEATARLPRMTPDEPLHTLTDPMLMNIPGARETIPPKVEPLTGQPRTAVEPLAHQLGGLSQSDQSWLERAVERTGFPYERAVPKQSGDREFDNLVNQHFFAAAQEILPDILDAFKDMKLTPALERDMLTKRFGSLKKIAFSEALDEVDQQTALKHAQSPGRVEKIARWQRWAEGELSALGKEFPPDADTAEPPDSGAPPAFEPAPPPG